MTVMNQIGDKPEEVRKHLEEEKRGARRKERKHGERAAPPVDPARPRRPDDETYEEKDRP
ncbi:hypothetical protein GCM10014713_00320 [Streptomyces purpureus]|uniref:Uncharacterized protein n=2 Tax=Streptomyces purpureus TaxID=1951 RepID=A0A918GVP8_9ACTN|nr:hypothetical protein GCM10014713_00320 [Streptomyces purpureus]